MTGSLDPVENQTQPETSRQPEGVADRLLRRKSASGVALPQIQHRLARITRASTRIRENRLVLPGSARRERILNFNTALRQKRAKAPRVTSRMAKNRQQVPWEQLDMSLPNGAPAENPRPDVLRASLGDVGFPSGGQVIAPFSPPDSSNEPSFLERRRARIGAQEEKKKPAASWKKPDPASRLFSRVEEIKPSGGTEKPMAQDHGAPKSSRPDAKQAASKKPEPTEQPASKGPASTPGKPSTVQREMAPGAVHMPPGMDNESRPEPEPAVKDREPETPLEETHSDLETLAPRKQPAKPAAETHQGTPVKPGRIDAPPAPRPAAKDAPPSPEPSREVRPQTGPRPSPEVKAPSQPRSLPDSPRQAAPRPAPPPPGKDVTKPAGRIEEDRPQPSPPAPGPSAASLPSAVIQRQPEREEKPAPEGHSVSREAGETDASRQPLAQPLAPRRTPPSPQTVEGAAPEKSEPPAPSVEQPRPVEISPASPFRPFSSEPEQAPPIPPVTAKPAALPTEKPFTEPELEKPLVFRPVLARMRSRSGPQAQPRLQTGPTKVARAAAIRTRTFPERITARGTANLVHRQMRPAARTLPAREPVSDQPLAASPAQQLPDLPATPGQPRVEKPRLASLPPVFARPPLRLSLRSLTAPQVKLARENAPRRISGQTAAQVRPSTARPVRKESRPLLLTQRGPAANTNTRIGSKPYLSPARPVEPAAGKPDLRAGAAPSSVPFAMPSFAPSSAPSSAPAFLPSVLPSGDPHPWGEKMLVTRSGRQWIQRQLQQGASSGVVSSRPDERQQPPTASSHESMVARHTTITPVRRVDPAASSRKADPKEKKPAGKMSPKAASSARPVGTEPVRSPVEDLPVVQPKKMAPVEQVIHRQMEVPGPVVQRAVVETPQIEPAPAYVDPEGNLDLAKLARDVYPIIKRMIAVEKERTSGRLY